MAKIGTTAGSRVRALGTILGLSLLALSAALQDADVNRTLVVGYLIPMDGGWDGGKAMASALSIAIDDVNKDPLIMDGYQLTFKWRNSQCAPGPALKGMSILLRENIDYLVGPSNRLVGPSNLGWSK